MLRVDDYDSTIGTRRCSVTPDYGADPELRLYPSLGVGYLLRSYPGGLEGDVELSKSGYQKDRPDRSTISHDLDLGDEGMSWIEQGADLSAAAMVRDETLVINVVVKTKPGTADPVALETLARKVAGIALDAAAST